ncbi:acyl-CoA-binding protein [Lutimonas vermicola]|uniref:Acyl-CoA-binding protein n=1 Tax=Lutimonas vermicola TaxID=414288 RepID=A0ABU9KVY2_9FLAO
MDDLDRRFKKAFEIASAMTKKLPPDIMLQFYSYYKHATTKDSMVIPSGDDMVRNAFKLNAYFQIANISEDDAKREYIRLVEKYSGEKVL